MAEEKKIQVKPAWKSKKVWSAIISGVAVVAIGFFGNKIPKGIDPNLIMSIIGFIGVAFFGAEQWKDGKVISTKILADAQVAIEKAQSLNKEQPKN